MGGALMFSDNFKDPIEWVRKGLKVVDVKKIPRYTSWSTLMKKKEGMTQTQQRISKIIKPYGRVRVRVHSGTAERGFDKKTSQWHNFDRHLCVYKN